MSLGFFNSLKSGRGDSNAAIQAFETDKHTISTSFIRELIQNAIDACSDSSKPVKLVFKLISIDESKRQSLKDLFHDIMPLIKGGHNSSTSRDLHYEDKDLFNSALVVEEFNTIGLTGEVSRTENEKADWHYSNYMFGVNRKTKVEGGGSAGVGKITANILSDLRTVLFLTNRKDDGETWVSGRSEFEAPYRFGNDIRADVAFITEEAVPANLESLTPAAEDKICQPCKQPANIDWFKDIFKIDRNKDETGTSWVMIAPLQQDASNSSISPLQVISHYCDLILEEYFWAIMRGKVEITLGGTVLNEETVLTELIDRFPERTESWEFAADASSFPPRSLVRLKPQWADLEDLKDAFLSEDERNDAIELFEEGNKVSGFKLPITVNSNQKNKQDSFVSVYMRKRSDEFKTSSEYLFRDYLHISGESNRLKRLYGDSVDCILLIEDEPVAQICRAAEKPDHTEFVIQRAHKRGFNKPNITIRNIRNSVVSIYKFLNELDAEDENILSSIFGLLTPKDLPKKQPGKPRKKRTKKTNPTYASPNRVNLRLENNCLEVIPGNSKFPANRLPQAYKINIIEKGLLGTHDLNQEDSGFENSTVTLSKNVTVGHLYPDSFTLEILDNDFNFKIDDVEISRTAEIRLED
jgi:hypothetical protein